ncbi:MAG: histidine phosphatase family protein [Bacteroidetes bacterium]|nr:histidine phosphatase family protein [Bacteroidota bacterium]
MKRQLVLIRHTKSSWSDLSLSDFERPIKQDRVGDAEKMAKALHTLNLKPQHIICSAALRTRQTGEYFYKALDFDPAKVQFDKRIYECMPEDLYEVIRETDAEVTSLVVIGHNPALTYFTNYYSGKQVIDMPTTGVAWLEFDTDNWDLDRYTPGQLKYMLKPKQL